MTELDYVEEIREKGIEKDRKQSKALGLLHVGGGICGKLVYEPLGDYEYLWQDDRKRGISKTEFNNDLQGWTIPINEKNYIFNGKPIKTLLFFIPSREKIEKWVSGELQSKTAEQLYKDVVQVIKICTDLPSKAYYDIGFLVVAETWLTEILNTVFYGQVVGGFGGGKTAFTETLCMLSRHASMIGSITGKGIPRVIERQKLNLFLDEVDVESGVKDSEKYMAIRQGYRRNNPFVRLRQDSKGGFEPEKFDGFGVKVYTLHSDIERALKTRGLTINIGETDDRYLPIVNIQKEGFGKQVYEDLYFWYLTNINRIQKLSQLSQLSELSSLSLEGDIKKTRKKIFEISTKGFSKKELRFIKKYKGRNVELGYISVLVSKVFGIDVLKSLERSFDEKKEIEAEFDESTYIAILKELLVDTYIGILERVESQESRESQESTESIHIDKRGIYFKPQSEAYKSFNDTLKEKNLNGVSPHTFKGYLLELGFLEHVNRKKAQVEGKRGKKSVYCLFFDKRVLNKLGIKQGQVKHKKKKEVVETHIGEDEEKYPNGIRSPQVAKIKKEDQERKEGKK